MDRPRADLFLVLNQTWDAQEIGVRTRDRQAILKAMYLVALQVGIQLGDGICLEARLQDADHNSAGLECWRPSQPVEA